MVSMYSCNSRDLTASLCDKGNSGMSCQGSKKKRGPLAKRAFAIESLLSDVWRQTNSNPPEGERRRAEGGKQDRARRVRNGKGAWLIRLTLQVVLIF